MILGTTRLLRLEVFAVLLVAIFGIAAVSLYQLHVNDDRLQAFEDALTSRKETLAALEEIEKGIDAHRVRILDQYEHTQRILSREHKAPCAPARVEHEGDNADISRRRGKRKRFLTGSDDGDDDAAAPEVEAPKGDKESAFVDQVVQVDGWMDDFGSYLNPTKITQSEGKRATIDQFSNQFVPVLRRMKKLLVKSNRTLEHIRHQYGLIEELWPRWFDEEGHPIYRGLFASNAVAHESCEQGLEWHQEYNVRHPAKKGKR